MIAWTVAAFVLLLALLPLGAVVVRSRHLADRLVALELAGTVVVALLLVVARLQDRSYLLDVSLTAAVLGLPAGIVFANFLERWL